MPVENTTYRGRQVLLGLQSDLTGDTLAKAIDISAFVNEASVTDTPQIKDVMPMSNNGQQAATIQGAAKITGNLNFTGTPRALMSMLIRGVYGKPATSQAKTASTWAATTVVVKGEIQKLSGGEYIVAQNAGTTGAIEPTASTDYSLLPVDGDVVWRQRDALFERLNHKTGFCTDKYIILIRKQEGCGSSNVFDRILEDVDLTYFTISKQDGAVSADQSIPFMAERQRRSSSVDFTDVTVTTTIDVREDYFRADDVTIRVDGAKYGTLLNFELTYTRNVTQNDSTEPYEQIQFSDAPTFTGTGSIRLDPAEYELLQATDIKSVVATFDGLDGEAATFTMPSTQFYQPTENVSGAREVWMDFTLRPTGDYANAMGTVDITTSTNIG